MSSPQIVSRLDQLMAQQQISGRQLAKEANVTEVTITKLRRNRFQTIDKDVAGRICRVLGITPGDLFTVENGSQQATTPLHVDPSTPM